MSKMSMGVGVTADRTKVTITLIQDDKQLGWIEFTAEQCDHFMRNVTAYRNMLIDKLPPPETKH